MSIGILAGPRSPEATTERGACSSRVQSRSGFARYNYGKVCLHPRSYEARQNLHPPDLPDNLTNWLINSILECSFFWATCWYGNLGTGERRASRPAPSHLKSEYPAEKGNMRTQRVLVFSFIFLIAVSCVAQLPGGSAPTTPQDRQTPVVNTAQTPTLDVFGGSGTVDKVVPGVIQLGLLDAIDRGLKHNLGLLLSQQQSELARAQYRRQLSALLPNVS